MADTPETPEVEDLMRYDILAQEALRGVVKKVLQEVAHTGLPGEHHFYVTFDTNHSGVLLSSRMKEKYPEEMTIVVQHQFWDLEATDVGFSIGLSFDNIPETMRVPYSAIVGFFDPAVQFGLQFDSDLSDDDTDEGETKNEQETPDNIAALPTPPKIAQIAKAEKKSKAKAKPKTAKKNDPKGKKKTKPEKPEEEEAASADVVSLDAFRKK
ncbi:MAG: ClpXP protease specificity-enhancing factor SspB [Rhizobiaceae bacterium]